MEKEQEEQGSSGGIVSNKDDVLISMQGWTLLQKASGTITTLNI